MNRIFLLCLMMGLVLGSTNAYAEPPGTTVMNDLQENSFSVRSRTEEVVKLSEKIRGLSFDIEDSAQAFKAGQQKEKKKELKNQVELLLKTINDLRDEASELNDLAERMDSKLERLADRTDDTPDRRCPTGRRWMGGHYNQRHDWVPGRCAPVRE